MNATATGEQKAAGEFAGSPVGSLVKQENAGQAEGAKSATAKRLAAVLFGCSALSHSVASWSQVGVLPNSSALVGRQNGECAVRGFRGPLGR
jgi:hypothetical protein